jgi:hypothetical protein
MFSWALSATCEAFIESVPIDRTFNTGILILCKRRLIYNISRPAVDMFINSASVVLSVTRSCCLDCYFIDEFLIYTMCPAVVLLVAGSSAQLASQCSQRLRSWRVCSLLKVSPNFFDLLKYLQTRLTWYCWHISLSLWQPRKFAA